MSLVQSSLSFQAWAVPALLVVPLVGAIVIRLIGRTALPGKDPGFSLWRDVRFLTMGTLVTEFLIAIAMWMAFDPKIPGYQFRVDWQWIPDWGARVTLGVDGISLVMIVLSTLLVPLSIAGSWLSIRTKVRTYYALVLVALAGMIGIFVALDQIGRAHV